MNIGIVTQPLANNYGGILQNYALQKVLIKLGHVPMTIDFQTKPISWGRYMIALIKAAIAFFIPSKRRPLPARYVNRRLKINDIFVNNHIHKTRPVDVYCEKLIDEYGFDALIVGSDQVWRPKYNQCLEDMYLNFASSRNVIKISYAASFGVDDWEYDSKQERDCCELIKSFNAVSVRESSGVMLCKNHLRTDAVEALDPTLLLEKDEYEELCSAVPVQSRNVLLAYVLDLSPEKHKYINRLAKKLALEPIIYRADSRASLTIQEWVAMFRDAKFTVTDSFHGTVFSIIFNKPFISLSNSKRGQARFYDLLEKLDLQERLIVSLGEECPLGEIAWNCVNKTLSLLREKSYKYLSENLE